ncbi:YceI family protein [Belliella kenyensis]|uniref:YceI family protein n=1 Tax=Belliella kenyensis TaxID=1472724 RepID=A0ABV8EIX6_9BACT|nr:YceI family protein [Belliella kenyensis]MCH7400359.1 YceI family protein [Belliella kenyensis]MDN3604623.1 YceI family protein [Belliella kenyensis]
MKRVFQLIIICFITTLAEDAFAQVYKTEKGKAEFLSKAPLNEFVGTSSNLNGLIDVDKNLVDFFIDLNTLKTGISLRDKHMRENYLETKKYPFSEFTGKFKTLPKFDQKNHDEVFVVGVFKIHGVEKQVEIPASVQKTSSNELAFESKFVIKLSDYKIAIPKVVFYELAEEQEVTISGVLKK